MSEPDPNPEERDFVKEYRDREKAQSESASWHRIAGGAGEFATSIIAATLVGYFLDRWLGTEPWLLVAGALLGFVVGLLLLLRLAKGAFE